MRGFAAIALAAAPAWLVLLALAAPSLAESESLAVCQRPSQVAGAPKITCRGPVHAKLAAFVFEFRGKLQIRHAGARPVLQTLTSPAWGAGAEPMILRDINFDGYADIHVVVKSNYGCAFHYFWLFEPARGRFGKILDERNLAIGGLSCGTIDIDAGRREITTRIIPRNSSHRITRRYKWRAKKLTLRRAVVRIYSRTGKCRERHYRSTSRGKLVGAGFRNCRRDAEVGVYPDTPGDRDLRKRETFDARIR
ncbi:MAG: XAC2610-related protein [Alphaproteobacteria bacterium]